MSRFTDLARRARDSGGRLACEMDSETEQVVGYKLTFPEVTLVHCSDLDEVESILTRKREAR